MKLASMGEFVYVCDIGNLRGIEFVVPFTPQSGLGGLASVLVICTENVVSIGKECTTEP